MMLGFAEILQPAFSGGGENTVANELKKELVTELQQIRAGTDHKANKSNKH
jgi:hypothetical protein